MNKFYCLSVYSDAGIDLSKPIIGMCIGGMSSCSLVLTAHLCGCPDVALYHVKLIFFNVLFDIMTLLDSVYLPNSGRDASGF